MHRGGPGPSRLGVGGLLLDALAKTADAMCSNVYVRNPSQRLYERKGFRVLGQGRGPLGPAMYKEFR
ncbi:hypothetical protein [Mycobacterium sp. C31M]